MKTCRWTVIGKVIHGSTVLLQVIPLPHLYFTAFFWTIYFNRYLEKHSYCGRRKFIEYHPSYRKSGARQHVWTACLSQQSFLCRHLDSACVLRVKTFSCLTSLREMFGSVSSSQYKQNPKVSELNWDNCKFLLTHKATFILVSGDH